MAPQQARMTMDYAKLIAALGMIFTAIFWSGKQSQKVDDVKDIVLDVKQELKEVRQEMRARDMLPVYPVRPADQKLTHNP